MTIAKALGGGLPIGALVTGERLADVLAPGDHGSTFAGGPVVAAAALAALDATDDPALLARVRDARRAARGGTARAAAASSRRARAGADARLRARRPRRPRSCAARCSSSGSCSTRPARHRATPAAPDDRPPSTSSRRCRGSAPCCAAPCAGAGQMIRRTGGRVRARPTHPGSATRPVDAIHELHSASAPTGERATQPRGESWARSKASLPRRRPEPGKASSIGFARADLRRRWHDGATWPTCDVTRSPHRGREARRRARCGRWSKREGAPDVHWAAAQPATAAGAVRAARLPKRSDPLSADGTSAPVGLRRRIA